MLSIKPSHELILTYCLLDPKNKPTGKLNLNQNTTIFAQENAFETVICKMSVILFIMESQNNVASHYINQCCLWHNESAD